MCFLQVELDVLVVLGEIFDLGFAQGPLERKVQLNPVANPSRKPVEFVENYQHFGVAVEHLIDFVVVQIDGPEFIFFRVFQYVFKYFTH